MRKEYASELTREELIKAGVYAVDFDNCRVYGAQGEINPFINSKGYFMINLYEVDEEGNRIKIYYKRLFKGRKQVINTYKYKILAVSLNRLLWAWKYGKVRAGYVIDHINNKHQDLEDYRLENLQEITPAENLAKERKKSDYVLKPGKNKTIQYYEEKLEKYLIEYQKAKKEHKADLAHKLRGNIAQQKAKIRWLQNYKPEKVKEELVHKCFKEGKTYEEAVAALYEKFGA